VVYCQQLFGGFRTVDYLDDVSSPAKLKFSNKFLTSRTLACCAFIATALRSSAKSRILRNTGVRPSPLGSHQSTHVGSRKKPANLSRTDRGHRYLDKIYQHEDEEERGKIPLRQKKKKEKKRKKKKKSLPLLLCKSKLSPYPHVMPLILWEIQ
jgi:hypothetical protein